MAKSIPIKLERDPIVEAIFEIRFQSKVPSVSTLLPGLMYSSLKSDFEAPERLPQANFLPFVAPVDPNLKYQPSFRIKNKEFIILLGDYSLIVSCPRPYVGWERFRNIILSLLKDLNNTDLILEVERISVKYLNLLEADSTNKQFGLLNMSIQLGNYDLTSHNTFIQSEIIEDGLINLIEIRSNVQLTRENETTNPGLLLAVDTISDKHENFWEKMGEYVDKVHSKEKQIFYSLLTDSAVDSCKPIWGKD